MYVTNETSQESLGVVLINSGEWKVESQKHFQVLGCVKYFCSS